LRPQTDGNIPNKILRSKGEIHKINQCDIKAKQGESGRMDVKDKN
jgi:hypothetical protein